VVIEMASMNQVVIVGNLTDDPELRYTPNGAAVVKFRVAVNRRYQDQSGQWKDGDTSYFTVNGWRTLAENVAESLTRGSRVVVVGRLQQRAWTAEDGSARSLVRSSPRSWGRACSGRPPRRSRPPGALGSSDHEPRRPGRCGGAGRW
jgi:single-strand DNA-binding protein